MERLSAEAGMSRATLHRAEKGAPGTTLETVAKILVALDLHADLDMVAAADLPGRSAQDTKLAERASPERRRRR